MEDLMNIIVGIIYILISSFIIMIVWNSVIANIVAVKTISYLMSLGITVALLVIGSFFRS